MVSQGYRETDTIDMNLRQEAQDRLKREHSFREIDEDSEYLIVSKNATGDEVRESIRGKQIVEVLDKYLTVALSQLSLPPSKREPVDRFQFLYKKEGTRFQYVLSDQAVYLFKCRDCGVPTDEIGEVYMVHDEIWAAAGMSLIWNTAYLCISCLETRLGRTLTRYDFTNAPLNTGDSFKQSPRLVERMNTERSRRPASFKSFST
jgi:hypothetical protein